MKKKNNLDEMQEQKLLQIERNGCWFCFWGLLVAMLVELIVLGPENWKALVAEWIIFMCLCLYLSIACMKQNLPVAMITGMISCVVTFVLCFITVTIASEVYKKRVRDMEEKEE